VRPLLHDRPSLDDRDLVRIHDGRQPGGLENRTSKHRMLLHDGGRTEQSPREVLIYEDPTPPLDQARRALTLERHVRAKRDQALLRSPTSEAKEAELPDPIANPCVARYSVFS
jgi:hypothetical protein